MGSWGRAGRLRALARLCAVGGVVLLLAGIALWPGTARPDVAVRTFATGGGGGTGGGSENVTVNVTDSGFDPQNVTVFAGDHVTFTVDNLGAYNHTFTLATIGNLTLSRGWTPDELTAFFARNGSLVNVSVAPGTDASAEVTLPTSDAGVSFEFVSLVPYQFQAGLFGFVHATYASSAGSYGLETNTTNGLRFVPDALAIPDAASFPITVSVEVVNAGNIGHTFWIEGQDNNTLLSGNFSTYFSSHPPLAAVDVPSSTGGAVWANFTITGHGTFEFICTVPGHFAGGMFGWLYVGYLPAPPPAPPSSALVDVAVLAGAGGLLGVALLLTVIGTFTGRFPGGRSPPAH